MHVKTHFQPLHSSAFLRRPHLHCCLGDIEYHRSVEGKMELQCYNSLLLSPEGSLRVKKVKGQTGKTGENSKMKTRYRKGRPDSKQAKTNSPLQWPEQEQEETFQNTS